MQQTHTWRGFTLIELLVVILIVGILAAVALPQYQKAVEKSKATEALTVLKGVYPAVQQYYLEHGSYPTSFSQLDVEIPWTGKTKWSTLGVNDTRSNGDWSLQLYDSTQNGGTAKKILIGRISGSYTGAGFHLPLENGEKLKGFEITCAERKDYGIAFTRTAGDYCEKLFNATPVTAEAQTYRAYILP